MIVKTKVVVFTTNNARILVNPPDAESLVGLPGVLVNPDLSHVRHVPLEYWAPDYENNRVVPLSEDERIPRAKLLKKAVDNNTDAVIQQKRKRLIWPWVLLATLVGAAVVVMQCL